MPAQLEHCPHSLKFTSSSCPTLFSIWVVYPAPLKTLHAVVHLAVSVIKLRGTGPLISLLWTGALEQTELPVKETWRHELCLHTSGISVLPRPPCQQPLVAALSWLLLTQWAVWVCEQGVFDMLLLASMCFVSASFIFLPAVPQVTTNLEVYFLWYFMREKSKLLVLIVQRLKSSSALMLTRHQVALLIRLNL